MKTRNTVVSLIKVGKIFDSKTLCEINIQNLLVKYENVLKIFPSELESPMSLPMNFFDFIFSRSSESSPQSQTNRSPPVVNDYPPKSHRWTTEVASAAFAVATGPPVAHRWKDFILHTHYWNNRDAKTPILLTDQHLPLRYQLFYFVCSTLAIFVLQQCLHRGAKIVFIAADVTF